MTWKDTNWLNLSISLAYYLPCSVFINVTVIVHCGDIVSPVFILGVPVQSFLPSLRAERVYTPDTHGPAVTPLNSYYSSITL